MTADQQRLSAALDEIVRQVRAHEALLVRLYGEIGTPMYERLKQDWQTNARWIGRCPLMNSCKPKDDDERP